MARHLPRSMEMRIAITSHDFVLDEQSRAYTEYKLFSSLARFAEDIEHVEVILSGESLRQARSGTMCSIHVILATAARLRTRAFGRGPYVAIDRAARRIEATMTRHGGGRLSS